MKNIVLLTIDCLRYDRCGFNGYHRNTTPTLDKLARDSLIFDHAYSTGPYTTESVPGIIAGQHSYNGYSFGGRTAWKAIRPDDETLATWLKSEGYTTLALISNPHLTPNRNFDRGFDSFKNLQKDLHTASGSADSESKNLAYRFRSLMRRLDSPKTLEGIYTAYRYSQYRQSSWPSKRAEDVLKELTSTIDGTDKPFFAWSHLMDLHAPMHPDSVREGGLSARNSLSILRADAARAGRRYSRQYSDNYDSALRYLDSQVASFINQLRSQGVWEDTVLILTADHGEALFDRNRVYGHPRHFHYDELLHVPLLVYDNTLESGRCQSHVSLAWLHEIMISLLDLRQGNFPESSGRENVLTDSDGTVVSDTLDGDGHTVSVRDAEQKLIRHQRVATSEDVPEEFRDRPLAADYRQDPKERSLYSEPMPEHLLATARERTILPEDLPTIGEGFSSQVEEQLTDLGYKM